MMIEPAYSPDEFFLFPTVVIYAARCENNECREIHGFGICLHWFWWGINIAWETGK